MPKVGAQKAAHMTGVAKSTIQRAMKSGKLSYEVDEQGQKLIDTSELDRVFGLKNTSNASSDPLIQAELQKAADMIEMERMKMRIRMLEDQLHMAQSQLDDAKVQRDQWQKQAQQVLLTSQASQKAADELKAELKEREQRERLARQKQMELRMKKLQAQNQNVAAEPQNFWDRLFKRA
jgi:hypothetical protein